jgi:predicted N-formylglutamate amidohydrolase
MIRYFAARPDICFGDNEPYSGRLKNDCMNRHATSRGLPHGLIEIRQDIASSAERREIWVNYLSQIMQNAALDEQCAACNRQ